jgi:hypothetical protein
MLIRDFIKGRENNTVNKGNTVNFHRYVNRKFSFKSAIKRSNGSVTTNPVLKAELLQSVFQSKLLSIVSPPQQNIPDVGELSHIVFSPPLIMRVIHKMRTRAKGGPDAKPPLFYKKCCDQLRLPLSFLLELSFHHSYLPTIWLMAYVTLVFKKGGHTNPNNYRPIALTCRYEGLTTKLSKIKILS